MYFLEQRSWYACVQIFVLLVAETQNRFLVKAEIDISPNYTIVLLGRWSFRTLTCCADTRSADPAVRTTYQWFLSSEASPLLSQQDMLPINFTSVNQSGDYICVASRYVQMPGLVRVEKSQYTMNVLVVNNTSDYVCVTLPRFLDPEMASATCLYPVTISQRTLSVGDSLVINCTATSRHRGDIYYSIIDNKGVTHYTTFLVVDAVYPGDDGNWTCTAENKYGLAKHTLTISVIDRSSRTVPKVVTSGFFNSVPLHNSIGSWVSSSLSSSSATTTNADFWAMTSFLTGSIDTHTLSFSRATFSPAEEASHVVVIAASGICAFSVLLVCGALCYKRDQFYPFRRSTSAASTTSGTNDVGGSLTCTLQRELPIMTGKGTPSHQGHNGAEGNKASLRGHTCNSACPCTPV